MAMSLGCLGSIPCPAVGNMDTMLIPTTPAGEHRLALFLKDFQPVELWPRGSRQIAST